MESYFVKPNTADSKGEVQIATGYGLEGAIPDITCGEIVDREILPAFRNGDYYGGLNNATNTLMSLATWRIHCGRIWSEGKKEYWQGRSVRTHDFYCIYYNLHDLKKFRRIK